MMSGCGILTNGKGTRREYCEFSLDELQVSMFGHVCVCFIFSVHTSCASVYLLACEQS